MRGGTLAVDHLYSLCEVGQKYDRKGCLRAAFVCDGDSGFAYHAESPEPNEPTGDVLVRSLLQAMRNSKLVPREVLVCNPEFKPLLAEFAQEFGLVVRVKKPLPYLEAFKKGLLERLGDPGVVPY